MKADDIVTGIYAGPSGRDIEQSFDETLACLWASADTPRLSGLQIKAPMFPGEGGKLVASTGMQFAHMLKPAGTSSFLAVAVIAFLAMALGRRAGFDTPPTSLAAMPNGMPPALIVECFEIRASADDTAPRARRFVRFSICLPKVSMTMRWHVSRAVLPLSSDPKFCFRSC